MVILHIVCTDKKVRFIFGMRALVTVTVEVSKLHYI
jgi:hypothetical protein